MNHSARESLVIPAKAGIHLSVSQCSRLDSRLRGNDEEAK